MKQNSQDLCGALYLSCSGRRKPGLWQSGAQLPPDDSPEGGAPCWKGSRPSWGSETPNPSPHPPQALHQMGQGRDFPDQTLQSQARAYSSLQSFPPGPSSCAHFTVISPASKNIGWESQETRKNNSVPNKSLIFCPQLSVSSVGLSAAVVKGGSSILRASVMHRKLDLGKSKWAIPNQSWAGT